MAILIRREREEDYPAVYNLVKAAFADMAHADGDEQDLVEKLRHSDAFIPELSLVAAEDGTIVGHILFTRSRIGQHTFLSLAPLAVLPAYQKQGIGTMLIREGHRLAKELGYRAVFLVGHAEYYPRFGYQPASRHQITLPIAVPDECFLACELLPGALNGVSGPLQHAREFNLDG